MYKLIITAAMSLFAATSAFAEVNCEKIERPEVATRSGYERLTVSWPTLPGQKGLTGFAAVEVFGLEKADARSFGDKNIQFIEACDTPEGPSLRYKVKAYPETGTGADHWHFADIPVPAGLKDVKVRRCSSKHGCASATYPGGGAVELEEGGSENRRSELR